jgi:hypothetical protein
VRDDRPAGSEAPAAVWFAYSPDRKGERPAKHLETYAGILQADGYAGFNKLYETGRIVEAAGWAHVRRKFHDLYQAHRSPIAKEALERIAQLYGIEQEIRGRSPVERREVRQTRSRPLLAAIHTWWKATLSKLSQKSDAAVAIRYALERWSALLRYCEDGRIEMDNNAAERRCAPSQWGVHCAPHFQVSENMDPCFSGFGRYGRPFRAIAAVTRASSRSFARI